MLFFFLLTYNYSFHFLPWWQLRKLWLELVSVVPEGKQGGSGEHEVTVVGPGDWVCSTLSQALAVLRLVPTSQMMQFGLWG